MGRLTDEKDGGWMAFQRSRCKNSAMEDSTAMTIEFLRVRLLAERSISRAAKAKVDGLTTRVMELEEQLKIISIQRKKAEKAAAEVLAILESHGLSDSFEGLDSSSDQDEHLSESQEDSSLVKKGEYLMTSKTRTEAEEGPSGSELESSPTAGNSLSWNSGSSHLNSPARKCIPQPRRRHAPVISNGGSAPKYRLGKSCREIKRREARAAADDVRDSSLLSAQEIGLATGLGIVSNNLDCRPENLNRCLQNEETSAFTENNGCFHANGIEKYGDMERALEQQAQLIGQYEAEENAQREWEEKYRVSNFNGEPQDSCEQGNQSDITEEKNEPQANEETEQIVTFSSYDDGAKLKTGKVQSVKEASTGTNSHGLVPTDSTAYDPSNLNMSKEMPGQQYNRMGNNEVEMGSPDFVFPAEVHPPDEGEGKQSNISAVVDSNSQPCTHEHPHDGTVANSSLLHDRDDSVGVLSGFRSPFRRTLPQSSNNLGGMLEALQRARVSADQQYNRMGNNESEMGSPDFVFPAAVHPPDKKEGKQTNISPPVDSNFGPHAHEHPHDGTVANSSPLHDRDDSEGVLSGFRGPLHRTLPHSSNSLGGVLEALQRAKVSLQHELELPSKSHSAMIPLPNSPLLTHKTGDAIDIPHGSAGLFRLPTECKEYNSSFPNLSRPYSDLGSTRHSADANFGDLSSYQYPTHPYIEPARSRISVAEPYFNPYMDSGLRNPAINRYSNPRMDLSMAVVPANDGHPGLYLDTRQGVPYRARYSLYDERFRSQYM